MDYADDIALVQTLKRSGNLKRALIAAKRLVDEYGDHPGSHKTYAKVLALNGHLSEAKREMEVAANKNIPWIQVNPTVSVDELCNCAYYYEVFDSSLSLDSNHRDALMGRIQRPTNDRSVMAHKIRNGLRKMDISNHARDLVESCLP